MPKKRSHYIGARFSEDEKKYIQDAADKRSMTLSDLLRDAIFAHITFLDENEGKIEKYSGYIIHSDSKAKYPTT